MVLHVATKQKYLWGQDFAHDIYKLLSATCAYSGKKKKGNRRYLELHVLFHKFVDRQISVAIALVHIYLPNRNVECGYMH